MIWSRIALPIALAVLLASCARSVDVPRPTAPRTPAAPAAPDTTRPVTGVQLTGAVSLRQAVAAAIAASPELRSEAWELRAAAARTQQASIVPNPILSLEVEDFAGTGAYTAFDQTQSTVQLSQVFDLSGRRRAAVTAASRGEELALWKFELRRLEIATETAVRYVDVAAAQRRLVVADSALALAERTRNVVAERVRSGKVAGTDETKARIAATNARVERDRAHAMLELAQIRLASLWGSPSVSFTTTTGSIDSIPAVPTLAAAVDRVAAHPSLVLRSVERAQREAVLDAERASTGLDLTAGAGLRYLSGSNDLGAVAGISIPLPFSSVNRGAVDEALARVQQADAERTADSLRLVAEVVALHARVIAARTEVLTIREQLLPDAVAAFVAVREGYAIGRFGLIDVLDAQRTLATTQAQYVTALEALYRTLSDLDALTVLSDIVQESISANP